MTTAPRAGLVAKSATLVVAGLTQAACTGAGQDPAQGAHLEPVPVSSPDAATIVPSSPTPAAAPSPAAPTTSAPATALSPVMEPAAGNAAVKRCVAGDLAATIGGVTDIGNDQTEVKLVFTNKSGATCDLHGVPGSTCTGRTIPTGGCTPCSGRTTATAPDRSRPARHAPRRSSCSAAPQATSGAAVPATGYR